MPISSAVPASSEVARKARPNVGAVEHELQAGDGDDRGGEDEQRIDADGDAAERQALGLDRARVQPPDIGAEDLQAARSR